MASKLVKEYHPNGHLQGQYMEVAGQIHGESKWWHENGYLSIRCHYHHGKLHGEFKWWYANGELRIHCCYHHGDLIVDFLKQPKLYPITEEERLAFTLKYNVKLLS